MKPTVRLGGHSLIDEEGTIQYFYNLINFLTDEERGVISFVIKAFTYRPNAIRGVDLVGSVAHLIGAIDDKTCLEEIATSIEVDRLADEANAKTLQLVEEMEISPELFTSEEVEELFEAVVAACNSFTQNTLREFCFARSCYYDEMSGHDTSSMAWTLADFWGDMGNILRNKEVNPENGEYEEEEDEEEICSFLPPEL